mmetsp:Transcript_3592/g.9984  ORF Transcript_3592/g.9984 Transcript_3592/m.9984 type:complete len:299 (-) Transcript_3592:58-954(-)|eukprot:CAMPEP_0185832660 /NCGR_PEP_ID=MMETSP1353-20130828/2212_1 /TAXON_ID=1077150 /ORGANISM="Erythrolobus australicus, Strain CCMP3124" /LENGTH=298 /DNA_ID=CAMNT_0028530857 /DNA_START=128 /DNA_END=1024 /DNA_ORIENTATION=+
MVLGFVLCGGSASCVLKRAVAPRRVAELCRDARRGATSAPKAERSGEQLDFLYRRSVRRSGRAAVAMASGAGQAELEPSKPDGNSAAAPTSVFSLGALSIVMAYLPSFAMLLRVLLVKCRNVHGRQGFAKTVLVLALLMLNPDLASSAAINLTNSKLALKVASKRKPVLRRVKPVVEKYKVLVITTCLLSACGFLLASVRDESLRMMALGAFLVVLGQNLYHSLARVKVLPDGSLKETSRRERIPVLSFNGLAMVLLLAVSAGFESVTPFAIGVFASSVLIYVVVKKTLQLVERLILS